MNVSKLAGHWGFVCGALLAGFLLAGCKSGEADSKFAPVAGVSSRPAAISAAPGSATDSGGTGSAALTQVSAPATTAGSSGEPAEKVRDLIQVGDTLVITFTDLPGLTQPITGSEERVKEDGSITLIQNQKFTAAGKKLGELESEIHERYVPNFFRTMTVSIKQKSETQFYYVRGEVKSESRQVYISRLTVLKAIASAGGFTDFARKKAVELTRADGKTVIKVNCIKAQSDPNLDLEIFPGDKIFVPRRNPIW